jgi:predicted phage gp36 major capsid-like protein
MDRNTVIIDGTKPGSPACSSRQADQQVSATGANGVEVYKASGTWVENLTVCNYLTNATGANGNEIWWNGGQGTGTIGMG